MNDVFMLCLAVLILSSGMIFYQDFKERQVSLWILLVFAAATTTSVIYFKGAESLFYNGLGIILYLGFIWLMLKLYLRVRYKKNVVILNHQMGAADIVVILCIGLTFDTLGMILFFCGGFIFSLLTFSLYALLTKSSDVKNIPLAGLLVFFYLIVIIIVNLIPQNFIVCSFTQS